MASKPARRIGFLLLRPPFSVQVFGFYPPKAPGGRKQFRLSATKVGLRDELCENPPQLRRRTAPLLGAVLANCRASRRRWSSSRLEVSRMPVVVVLLITVATVLA